MVDHLRKLGLVVEVDNGTVVLMQEFTAATAGEALTPEQAKMLVHLDKKLDSFSVKLECYWCDGKFHVVK